MYPNLDTEQARRGHTDIHIAGALGITVEEFQARKASKTMELQEAVALAEMYELSTEYLFRTKI
jgi:hypothetical protein